MEKNGLLAALREMRCIQNLDEEHLERIAAAAEVEEFPDGAVIFREGDHVAHVYLVVDGSVALEIRPPGGRPKRIHTVGSGELLGWSPLLGQPSMTATARALTITRTIRLETNQLLAACEHTPKFGFELMRRTALALANRLAATRLQLMDVFGDQHPSIPREED